MPVRGSILSSLESMWQREVFYTMSEETFSAQRPQWSSVRFWPLSWSVSKKANRAIQASAKETNWDWVNVSSDLGMINLKKASTSRLLETNTAWMKSSSRISIKMNNDSLDDYVTLPPPKSKSSSSLLSHVIVNCRRKSNDSGEENAQQTLEWRWKRHREKLRKKWPDLMIAYHRKPSDSPQVYHYFYTLWTRNPIPTSLVSFLTSI